MWSSDSFSNLEPDHPEQRPQAGGKTLLALEGDRFQAPVTNLPSSVPALAVWRRYNGRADLERARAIRHGLRSGRYP